MLGNKNGFTILDKVTINPLGNDSVNTFHVKLTTIKLITLIILTTVENMERA